MNKIGYENFSYNGGLGQQVQGCGDFNGNGIDDMVALCYPDFRGGKSLWVFALDRDFASAPDDRGSIGIPGGFYLHPPFPNPFNNNVEIRFDLARPGRSTLAVYSLDGRLTNILADRLFTPGSHRLIWDAGGATNDASLSTGIYVVKLTTPAGSAARTTLLVR